MTEKEMIEYVKGLQPDKRYRPESYLQGYCTLAFSVLARWKGFPDAVRETEGIIGRDVCPGCKLVTTYQAFREMESRVGQTQTT